MGLPTPPGGRLRPTFLTMPRPSAPQHRHVDSGPVRLGVTEQGPADAQVQVLLVHGFPDDSTMWDDVVAGLPTDWHVVRYDVRGAGRSDVPRGRAAYRMEELVLDLEAVVGATVPADRQVHLVGHDWGGIATWLGVDDQAPSGLRGRVASYTCMSGPSIDHLGLLGRDRGGWRRLMPQLLHSWYVWLTLLPRVPELLWGPGQRWLRPLVARIDPSTRHLPWGRSVSRNGLQGVELYRANVVRRLRRPRDWSTDVPVLLLVATEDPWVTPLAMASLERRCSRLRRVEVAEGHWLPRARPAWVAQQVREQVGLTSAT